MHTSKLKTFLTQNPAPYGGAGVLRNEVGDGFWGTAKTPGM